MAKDDCCDYGRALRLALRQLERDAERISGLASKYEHPPIVATWLELRFMVARKRSRLLWELEYHDHV